MPFLSAPRSAPPAHSVRVVIHQRQLVPLELAHDAKPTLTAHTAPPTARVAHPSYPDLVFRNINAVYPTSPNAPPYAIYDHNVAPLLVSLFARFNSVFFVYGQISAGKSNTMNQVTAHVTHDVFAHQILMEREDAMHASVRIGVVEISRKSWRMGHSPSSRLCR